MALNRSQQGVDLLAQSGDLDAHLRHIDTGARRGVVQCGLEAVQQIEQAAHLVNRRRGGPACRRKCGLRVPEVAGKRVCLVDCFLHRGLCRSHAEQETGFWV